MTMDLGGIADKITQQTVQQALGGFGQGAVGGFGQDVQNGQNDPMSRCPRKYSKA
jgi:hypothetical protein